MPCPKNCNSCTSCCKNRVIKGNLVVCGDITFGNCLKTQGEIRELLTVEAPCLTVGCNVTLEAFEFGVQSREFKQLGTPAQFPINLAPIATIPETNSIVVNGLKITNIRGDGVYPSGTGGPWYVESGTNVNAPDATKVVTCGIRDPYLPESISNADGGNSPNNSTTSQATITLDPTAPANSRAIFDLHLGYSSEVTFDFLNVYKNDVLLFSQSGNGPSALDPYLTGVLPQLSLGSGDTIKIEFAKDFGAYSGVDSTYFYLKNQIFAPVPAFPTTIKLIRDSIEILKLSEFAENPDDVPLNSSVQFVKEIELQSGDQICLDFDVTAYSDYTILFKGQKRIGGNIYELDNYKAPLQTNSLIYNLRKPAPSNQLGGWYECDDPLAYAFVEDAGSELLVNRYHFNGNRKNLINGLDTQFNQTWTKNDDGSYTDVIFTGMSYIFDPVLKQLRSDFTNNTNVEQLGIAGFEAIVYRKVGKPDERFSKYSFDIQNDDQIFNDPRTMFDMLHDYYSGGRNTAYGSESKPLLEEINPLELVQTQVQRGFGGVTKSEFEDLYIKLRDQGVLRKYNTKRFIYWQDPDGEALSPATESALRWQVNQQRSELLGFVCDNPEENENPRGYAKLVPGENVVMKGSGTRLDDTPLSLYLDGYHTGPKPGAGFIPDSQYDNWSFYSIQLPLVIDSTNDKLFITPPSGSETQVVIPHGNYTNGQLRKVINDTVNTQLPTVGMNCILNLRGTSFTGTNGQLPLNQLEFNANSGTIINSPTKFVNPSTLLGPLGLNIGNTFISDQVIYNSAAPPNPKLIIVSGAGGSDGTNTMVGHSTFSFSSPTKFNVKGLLVAVSPITATNINEITNRTALFGNIAIIQYNGSYSNAVTACKNAGAIGVLVFRLTFPIPQSFGIGGNLPVLTIGDAYAATLLGNLVPGATTVTMIRNPVVQSYPNDFVVHTPLTSDEANAIVANVGVITVESTHGPVANDMSYPNFIACSAELSWAYSTEVHNLITPYIRPIKYGAGELFQTLDELLKYLNDPLFVIPPGARDPGVATYFTDDFGVTPLRGLGTGHPAEMSEMYSPGLDRSFTESMINHSSRAEWIVPNDRMYYPEGTVVLGANVANGGGNISNWSVDVPVINYLEEPLWLVSRPGTLGEVTFQFDPYTTHQGEFQQNADGSPLVTNPDIVDGEFLIGVLKDSEVTKVLGNVQSFKVGYIRHFSSDFSFKGDPTKFVGWFDPNYGTTECMALLAAGTVIKYFNDNNVKHIIIDIRNTVGGLSTFFKAFTNLVGGDRKFADDQVNRINGIDQNDVSVVRSLSNGQKYAEDAGVLTYTLVDSLLDCKPSDLEAKQGLGQLDFPQNSTFKEVSANVEDQKRIIWFTNATTISGTQYSYLIMKGSSLNQDSSDANGFDGDLGNNVRFIGYGCYYRPFSTAGNYTSYINWYGVNRAGSEFIKKPLLYSIDRPESLRYAYIDYVGRDENDDPVPVLKGFDQDFTKFHQPQIKWNMEADIFFGDIGYVVGGNVDPDEGVPWVPLVDANVDFHNPLTWRDRTLEKSLVLATDLNVENHFYVDDGFGNI